MEVTESSRYVLVVQNLDTNETVLRENQLTSASFAPGTALVAGNYRAWVKAIDSATDLFRDGLWSRGLDFSVA